MEKTHYIHKLLFGFVVVIVTAALVAYPLISLHCCHEIRSFQATDVIPFVL
jgi:hypothetical protein